MLGGDLERTEVGRGNQCLNRAKYLNPDGPAAHAMTQYMKY
jgi:hypothetical protein